MKTPKDHLRRLEADLSGRERWLRTLRLHIAGLQDEASTHEMILALGRDPDILRVVHELNERPELGARIAEDPRSFLDERGVQIPKNATVTATGGSQQLAIEIQFAIPNLEYGVGWSPRRGFYLVNHRRR